MVGASGAESTGGLLLSATGRELLGRLAGEDVSPERALALSASLRAEYPAELVAAALTQQALRVAARAKFALADRMLFTRAGLEQASSELTARHAAGRFAGSRLVADLCCGIGGNLVALAAPGSAAARAAGGAGGSAASGAGGKAAGSAGGSAGGLPRIVDDSRTMTRKVIHDHERYVVGIDADPLSVVFARHNVSVCAPGARVAVVRADVTEFPPGGFDAVFVDPARRDGQRRLGAGQYRPPLPWCLRLTGQVPRVGIKAAPGIRRELVPAGWETEFVAVGRELKEALLWSPELAAGGVTRRATILPAGHTLTAPAAAAGRISVPLAAPGSYLLDPSPAVTRAGLVAELADRLGAWQIDPMIAFLSSDEPLRTPFARTLRVLESAPWHEKRFARRLRELGIGSADIRRRGLAGDIARIHRRLGLAGPGAATLVLTRVNDRPWGLICDPLPTEAGDGGRADAGGSPPG
ncbi:MAG TPA: class I SAM-dependent methyltransferase [Streptosporangiaceae bacterium]|nr:class I SAM-dependent methyltransferase [Streptosporangiaceae bacterium]